MAPRQSTSTTGTIVNSGGTVAIFAGGSSIDAVLVGGTEVVSGGDMVNATIIGGGIVIISAGGVTFGTHSELTVAGSDPASFTISGFKATDTLNLASFAFSSQEKLSFTENKAKTSGVLTVIDGTSVIAITLFGQYVAAGFHTARDGAAGAAITYTTPAAAHLELAGDHRK